MNFIERLLCFFSLTLFFTFSLRADWEKLEPGLDLGTFETKIHILRINPDFFELRLLNASASDKGLLHTAKHWCKDNNLVAAINSSMYLKDYKTSISYMRSTEHVNNPRMSKDKTILAFERLVPEVPKVKIIDQDCETFSTWRKKYGSFVQSIRMISCKGENVWHQQPQKWSIAALGTDRSGNILFIHSKKPFSTHNFINLLLSLPIKINRAMYAEGGTEAQLYIKSRNREYEFTGVPEGTGETFQFDFQSIPIPNVVGIRRLTQ